MDYIRQHKRARERLKSRGLGAMEWHVYSELFSRLNSAMNLGGSIEIPADELARACGIKSHSTLAMYRKNLVKAGMINYTPGHGRGTAGIYSLVDLTGGIVGHLKGTITAVEKPKQEPALEPEPEIPETPETGLFPEAVQAVEPETTAKRARRKKAEPPAKRPYGTYQNVMLSDFQYKKLLETHGAAVVADYIEKISSYVYEKPGRAYTDYMRAVNNWIKSDKLKGRFRHPVPAAPALPAATDAEKAAAAVIENDVDDMFKAERAAREQDWQ